MRMSLGGISTGVPVQRLSDVELAAGTSLGRRLIQSLRAGRVPASHSESFSDRIEVRIPAVAATVGDLEVRDDGDEYTVSVGRHTHTHFTPALSEAPTSEAQEIEALEQVLEYLTAIVRDEVVIWSEPGAGGGTFGLEVRPHWLSPRARAWLWSGKAYQPSA
jgi:hypothetical protein